MLDAADVKSSLGYCFLVTYVKKREKKSTLRIMEDLQAVVSLPYRENLLLCKLES